MQSVYGLFGLLFEINSSNAGIDGDPAPLPAFFDDDFPGDLLLQFLAVADDPDEFVPGSQIVQIVGITALDKLDHYIKERLRIEFYIRYMDDFVILSESKERLKDGQRTDDHVV